jgi:hypothetical protein
VQVAAWGAVDWRRRRTKRFFIERLTPIDVWTFAFATDITASTSANSWLKV